MKNWMRSEGRIYERHSECELLMRFVFLEQSLISVRTAKDVAVFLSEDV